MCRNAPVRACQYVPIADNHHATKIGLNNDTTYLKSLDWERLAKSTLSVAVLILIGLPWVFSVIDHRGYQYGVRASNTHARVAAKRRAATWDPFF